MSGNQDRTTSTTPAAQSAGNDQVSNNASSSQLSRRRNKTNKGIKAVPVNRFKGKCKDIEDYVYDLGLPNGNQDLYTVTTEAIAEYAAKTFDNAGEFRLALKKLDLPDLTSPKPPSTSTDIAAVEIYKLKLSTYHKAMVAPSNNSSRIFALILGQCAPSVRNKIEAEGTWNTVDQDSDCIALLKLIRKAMYQKSTTRDNTQKFVDAEIRFNSFRQTERMSIGEYYRKFTGVLEMFEDAGGKPGVTDDRIKQYMVDPNNGDVYDKKQATEKARGRYLGLQFLLRSYQPRYGNLITDMTNNRVQGIDGYPDTLAKAYEMLVSYQPRFT